MYKKRWIGLSLRNLFCALLFLVPVLYLSLSFLILVAVGRYSYGSIVSWYGAWRPDTFDVGALSGRCFTPRWYEVLRTCRLPLMGGILVASGGYLVFSRRVWSFLQGLGAEIGKILGFMVRVFRESSDREKGWLLLLFAAIVAYRGYLFFAFQMSTDETCSYLYFARQGFLVTATSYPLPNNHVLFNIICCVFSKLPWLAPRVVMRLPSLVSDLALLYGIFCLFRRWDGFGRAIGVLAGVAFCYHTSFFAVQGRGYALENICVLMSGLACWECFCGRNRHLRRGYALFIIFSVAGIYINPTYLYHFTALLLLSAWFLWRRRDKETLFVFVGALATIGGLVLILYGPLVLASSWGSLSGNTRDPNGSLRTLVSSFPNMAYDLKYMTYYGYAGFYFMVGFTFLSLYLYRKKKLAGDFYDHSLAYLLAMAGSLIFWALYTRLYPMERTLCFFMMANYILFVNICYDLFRVWFSRAAPWVFGCFLVIKAAGSLRGVYWERFGAESQEQVITYRMVEKDLEELDRLHPASWQVTDTDDYYPMYLRLLLIERGDKGKVIFERKEASGEVVFCPDKYPMTVPAGEYSLWGDKKLTAESRFMNIYIVKKRP